MRYSTTETTYMIGQFNTGDIVTLTLYDLSDGSLVTLTSNACTHISDGVFKWSTADIETTPTTRTEYLWIMDNGTKQKKGKIVLGGYIDEIAADVWGTPDAQKLLNESLRKAVVSADELRVTVYEADGVTISHEFDISEDKKTRTPV